MHSHHTAPVKRKRQSQNGRARFGSWSHAGCRFVERILTVVQTRRLQGKNVLEYLHDAVLAHRTGQTCPQLLPDG